MPRWNYKNELERFEHKLNKLSNGCWEWKAHKNQYGYGVFRFDGKMGLAHRFAYDRYVRSLKTNEDVDHLCFNRSCCNPKHLQAVSHATNLERSTKRNRQRSKCSHGHDAKHTYITNDNRMRCRICRREQIKKAKQNARSRRNSSNR